MRIPAIVICLCVLALLSHGAHAGTTSVIVPVTEDASVNALNPDGNLNTITTRGGLFSGLDNFFSDYHFFLKFSLPTLAAGETVKSAILIGTYTDKYGGPASFHQIYFIPSDAWSESTVTFNTAPAFGDATSAAFEAFGKKTGTSQSFDITQITRQEINGDKVLSLGVATVDGRLGDLEYFASKEFGAAQGFRLQLSVQDGSAIPLPSGVALGASGTALAALAALAARFQARRYASR